MDKFTSKNPNMEELWQPMSHHLFCVDRRVVGRHGKP